MDVSLAPSESSPVSIEAAAKAAASFRRLRAPASAPTGRWWSLCLESATRGQQWTATAKKALAAAATRTFPLRELTVQDILGHELFYVNDSCSGRHNSLTDKVDSNDMEGVAA